MALLAFGVHVARGEEADECLLKAEAELSRARIGQYTRNMERKLKFVGKLDRPGGKGIDGRKIRLRVSLSPEGLVIAVRAEAGTDVDGDRHLYSAASRLWWMASPFPPFPGGLPGNVAVLSFLAEMVFVEGKFEIADLDFEGAQLFAESCFAEGAVERKGARSGEGVAKRTVGAERGHAGERFPP